MAEQIERVTRTENTVPAAPAPAAAPVADRQQSVETRTTTMESGTNVVSRVIWYIAGVLLILLAFRFVFALLGANPNNSFANFIYSTSHPFVAPFFGLFGYDLRYGISRFESFTLVAMAVYALIAWGLVKLVTLRQPRP